MTAITNQVMKIFQSDGNNKRKFFHELLINGNKTSFMFVDDIQKGKITMTGGAGRSTSGYYGNINTSKAIRDKTFKGNHFLISYNTPYQWEITNETKKIGKYTCYKAKTTTLYVANDMIKKLPVIAWFTPEIPVSSGPENYMGLPGLILDLYYNRFRYVFSSIETDDNIGDLTPPTKGERITEDEYRNILLNSE